MVSRYGSRGNHSSVKRLKTGGDEELFVLLRQTPFTCTSRTCAKDIEQKEGEGVLILYSEYSRLRNRPDNRGDTDHISFYHPLPIYVHVIYIGK